MKPLGKDAEELILQAIDKTASLVNDGIDPTQAVIKTAEALNLSPGNVTVLVNAYNTGYTGRQRQNGEGVLEKIADFPLANPVAVFDALYPKTHKTAAALRDETVVSLEYAVSPAGMLARRNETLRKEAAAKVVIPPLCSSPKPLPVDTASLHKQAAGKVQRMQREVEEARREKHAAFDRLASRTDDLANYFRLTGREPFGWFRKQAELIYGAPGKMICDLIATDHVLLAKQADDGKLRPAKGAAFELLGRVLDLVDDFNTKQAAHTDLSQRFVTFEKETLRPFVPPPSYISFDEFKRAGFGPFGMGMAGGAGKGIFDSIANSVSAPNSDAVNKVIKQLSDPQHEADLRNVRLQSMLQDVMTTDPIVSGYPAHEVTNAFNELNMMAPRLAEQPGIMGSALAKRLQQGRLSDFEVDQLLSSENRLKQRDEVSSGLQLRLPG